MGTCRKSAASAEGQAADAAAEAGIGETEKKTAGARTRKTAAKKPDRPEKAETGRESRGVPVLADAGRADEPEEPGDEDGSDVPEARAAVLAWGGQLDGRLHVLGEAMQAENVDFLVQVALLNRALGYDYLEEKTEYGGTATKRTQTRKHQPGDLSAQTFWLKNRRPELWRDKPEPVAGEGRIEELIEGLLEDGFEQA